MRTLFRLSFPAVVGLFVWFAYNTANHIMVLPDHERAALWGPILQRQDRLAYWSSWLQWLRPTAEWMGGLGSWGVQVPSHGDQGFYSLWWEVFTSHLGNPIFLFMAGTTFLLFVFSFRRRD
jgi:hypothetical protein